MTEPLSHNTDPRFVGIAELKRKQTKQLAAFEQSAARGDWQAIHNAHYDWWMFPIDEPSKFGKAYTVYAGDIAELKQDAAYVQSYLRGVELLAFAWGWDLAKRQYVPKPQPGQKWSDWAIRLYKAARSLQLFGYTDAFESLKTFALDLLRTGQQLQFNGKDLSRLFTENQPR